MKRPTKDQLQRMAHHPVESVVVLTIDLVLLPLHIAYITTEKIIHKFI